MRALASGSGCQAVWASLAEALTITLCRAVCQRESGGTRTGSEGEGGEGNRKQHVSLEPRGGG